MCGSCAVDPDGFLTLSNTHCVVKLNLCSWIAAQPLLELYDSSLTLSMS